MKVYIIKPDTNFRFLFPDEDVYYSEYWEFKCRELAGKLPKFQAEFDKKSDNPIPDIACLGMTTLAFSKEAATELVYILEDAGELLPFYVGEDLWYCYNITKSIDALDEEKTTFKIFDGVNKMFPNNYVFKDDLLSESTIFKIPTDNFTDIFCVDRRDTDDQVMNNFFCAIAYHGYTGIEFEEVYSN